MSLKLQTAHAGVSGLLPLTTLAECQNTTFVYQVKYLVIGGEDVEGQRFLSLVDKLDGFIQAADGHDGKQRSKYLLLHYLRLWLHVTQNCGG